MAHKLSLIFYGIAAAGLVITGLFYLLWGGLLPYHLAALETTWEQIAPNYQALFWALVKAVGGGCLAAGLAMGFLVAFPWRKGETWALWALLLVGFCSAGPLLVAVLHVRANTPGNPPLGLLVLGLALGVAGLAAGLASKKDS
jgi:FtsH-binding integral membrane protein